MTSNHDLALVTLFQSTLEHTLNHFLDFQIFEGVRHFLGLLNQPPTPLLTLIVTMFPNCMGIIWWYEWNTLRKQHTYSWTLCRQRPPSTKESEWEPWIKRPRSFFERKESSAAGRGRDDHDDAKRKRMPEAKQNYFECRRLVVDSPHLPSLTILWSWGETKYIY